ncbi:MAG: 3-hydroxyacyl-CoA dehydrogenase family protein [Sporichthyaceae bacterium]
MIGTAFWPIEHVAVLGFGTMGAGIVEICARAGHQVSVLETDADRLAAGHARVEKSLARAVERGKISAADSTAALSRITGVLDVAALSGADLVIEAVVEVLEVKVELLRAVAAVVRPEALLATNTSALSVTDIASALPGSHRVGGLHFFNPVPVMELVEVIRALQTDENTARTLLEFAAAIGKTAIEAPDRPGFLLNHLLMPYLNDVVQAYDDGLATARDIDTALHLGLGYPVGPLALLDVIGLDVHCHATSSAYAATLDPAFAPPPLLRQMVAAGYHGHKTGRGFVVGTEDTK